MPTVKDMEHVNNIIKKEDTQAGIVVAEEIINDLFEEFVYRCLYEIHERRAAVCAVAKISGDELMNLLLKKSGEIFPQSIKTGKSKQKTKERIISCSYYIDVNERVFRWVTAVLSDKA
ncbi:MAG: hypothetical protein INF44_06520 [Thalassospira sp.]|nr:hypothetical protein [Thalassospira sp.]